MECARTLLNRRALSVLVWLAVASACASKVQEPPRNPEKLVDTEDYKPASDDNAPVRAPPPRYGNRIVERDVAVCPESASTQKRAADARCPPEQRKPGATKSR
jgi:hypothetical protein